MFGGSLINETFVVVCNKVVYLLGNERHMPLVSGHPSVTGADYANEHIQFDVLEVYMLWKNV